MAKLGKVTKTSRGFELIEFVDRYGVACSLQASSLADHRQPGVSAILIGPNDPNPKCLHGNARALGIQTEATCGWVDYPLPDAVSTTTRAHLDRKQVKALIAHLQSWLDTGSFKHGRSAKTEKGGK